VRLTRVFVAAPLRSGSAVELAGSAASHLQRVLRLRPGDALTLFNGEGGEYAGRIARSDGRAIEVTVGSHHAIERESPLAITLAQGISRADRMDLVVQKATELGITRLVPLLTARSVVKLSATQALRKREHWQQIAIGACEQSGRNRLPELTPSATLGEFLSRERAPRHGHARILLSPSGAQALGAPPHPVSLCVLIGPEGGLTEEEQAAALAGGFQALRLGPRILRTETAALAALTLLQHRYGDL
jgi:16S rRNA (uracil1498-N3)-methyltransferase